MTATLVEPTILYLNLAIEIVRKWRSFDDPTDLSLSSTVKGIIHQIFTKMERDYGRQLVSWAFAFITFSRDGMNDQEIRDCLSKQSLVCQEVFQYSQMGQHAFPMHVWLRVKLAIRSLLFEQQEGHGTRWYHRQLWETAEERFNSVRTESHSILAHYFQAQPRVLIKDVSVWSSTAKINRRRIREAYYHWLKLIEFQIPIDYPKVIEEVCCLEMLYASAVLDDLFSVAIALEEPLSALPASLPLSLSQRVNDYSVYLKAEASTITMKPFVSLSITASAEPSSSSVYRDFLRTVQHDLALSHHLRINGKDPALHPLQRDHVWCQVLSGNSQEGNPWEMNLSSHEFGVRSVSWSPDDTKVVSGAFDDLIKIWDAKTGQVLMTLEGHDEEVASVCWHPVADSSLVASGSWDNVVMIWNTKTGELVQTLDGHSDCVSCVVWSHDGKLLATASRDSTIKIWDTRSSLSSMDDDDIEFTELLTLSGGHTSEILCAAWNNQGSLIASGGEDKNIVLWDIASRLVVKRLVGHEESVQAISWHPADLNLLASCSFDRSICIWNTSSSSIIRLIEEAHSNRVTCIRWNPVDGYRLASTSYDMTIKVWDYNNGQLLTTLEGHTEEVYCVNWNHDGTRLISGSEDNNIKVWSCPEQRNQSDNRKGSSEILSVGFNCTGEYLAAANKQLVTIWEGQTGEVRGMIQEESKCLDWHPIRSSWLATGSSKENALCIWDVHTLLSDQNTQVPIIRLLGHSRPISICQWHPTGNWIATGSWDESAKIWFIDAQNPSRSTMIISLDGHKWRVFSLSWNCTGSLLATASVDGIIYIWKPKLVERKDDQDNSSSAFVVGLTGHNDSVFALDWHPSNPTMLASGSDDHTIRIWDVFQSASSPFITIVCDRFDEIKCLRWHFHRIKEVYSIIAGSWNHCIKIFDFPTGNLVMVLDGYHTECINSIQLSKEWKRLVSGSHDKSVKVFYLE